MASAFLLPAFADSLPPDRWEVGVDVWLAALLGAALLLAVGSAISYPFEMDLIVRLADNRLVPRTTASTTRLPESGSRLETSVPAEWSISATLGAFPNCHGSHWPRSEAWERLPSPHSDGVDDWNRDGGE